MESVFFFASENRQLCGVLHTPEMNPKDIGIVFCAPFGEEKQESHRVMVNFARLLTTNGIHVLRFDYYGTGDSQGDWGASTWESHLSDISAGIGLLQSKGCKQIGLFGLRLGGTLARVLAGRNPLISFIILWEPVIDVGEYLLECLRANLTTQMMQYGRVKVSREQLLANLEQGIPVNINGYPLTKPFYDQAKAVNLVREKPYPCPSLLIRLKRTEKSTPCWPDFKTWHPNYDSAETEISLPHLFWNESFKFYFTRYNELFDFTLGWLEGIFNGSSKRIT
jgi:exosortase A-associated hydrolase 2